MRASFPACLSACPESEAEAVLTQRRAGAAARRRGAARKAERAAMEDMFASVWAGVDGGCGENAWSAGGTLTDDKAWAQWFEPRQARGCRNGLGQKPGPPAGIMQSINHGPLRSLVTIFSVRCCQRAPSPRPQSRSLRVSSPPVAPSLLRFAFPRLPISMS